MTVKSIPCPFVSSEVEKRASIRADPLDALGETRHSAKMGFWTYLLRCADGRYYTGHTEDLDVRLAQHQQGYFRNCWTYRRRPVRLVWSEALPTLYEALEAERRIGGWSVAKKEALIRGDWKLVSYFAKPPLERVDARFSTSLETNGGATETPFVSSEVEKPFGRDHNP